MTMYYYPEDLGLTGSSNVISGVGSDGNSSLKISATFKANSTTTQSVYASFEQKPIVFLTIQQTSFIATRVTAQADF